MREHYCHHGIVGGLFAFLSVNLGVGLGIGL